jgi:hypothetical protein
MGKLNLAGRSSAQSLVLQITPTDWAQRDAGGCSRIPLGFGRKHRSSVRNSASHRLPALHLLFGEREHELRHLVSVAGIASRDALLHLLKGIHERIARTDVGEPHLRLHRSRQEADVL